MKHYCLLFILIFTFTKGFSKTVPGYIVTLGNDTISTLINLPGFLGGYNMNKKVEIVDSSGEIKVFTPMEIKAYGYKFKSKDYIYIAKMISDSSLYFLEPVIKGQNTSLYQHVQYSGPNTSSHEYYTFEKSDGTYLFLTNYAALDTFKEKLKIFYKENLEVQKLIDKKFNARRHIQTDIQEILKAVNQP
ncbi:MAG: hypothetical protein ABJB11_23120 [Ferruginibacter sp.]